MKYTIEIHDPNQPDHVIETIESNQSYMNITVGDFISTVSLPNCLELGNKIEVIEVVHFIGKETHTVCLYTQEV